MASRVPGFEPPKNPFEQSGLSQEVVEAIAELRDPDALRLVLKGVHRAVSRSLHPDVNQGLVGEGFYTDFIQGHDALSAVLDEDLLTLANGYTKRRARARTSNRNAGDTERVSREYIRDGSLLEGITEMIMDTGESVASSKGFDILVAPKAHLPSTQKEVYDDKTVARTTVISVSYDGRARYTNYASRRFSEGMTYNDKDFDSRAREREAMLLPKSVELNRYLHMAGQASSDRVADDFAALFSPTHPHQYPTSHTNELSVVINSDETLDAFTIEGHHVAHLVSPDVVYRTLLPGRYHLLGRAEQFAAGNSPRFLLRDDYKSVAKDQPQESVADFLVMGTLDTEYMQYEVNKFRDLHGHRPGELNVRLPGSYRRESAQIPLFPLRRQEYARVEGMFCPRMREKELLLVVSSAGELSIAGSILELTRKSL